MPKIEFFDFWTNRVFVKSHKKRACITKFIFCTNYDEKWFHFCIFSENFPTIRKYSLVRVGRSLSFWQNFLEFFWNLEFFRAWVFSKMLKKQACFKTGHSHHLLHQGCIFYLRVQVGTAFSHQRQTNGIWVYYFVCWKPKNQNREKNRNPKISRKKYVKKKQKNNL